jgi:hypothetical protein
MGVKKHLGGQLDLEMLKLQKFPVSLTGTKGKR